MIIVLTTRPHRVTHTALAQATGFDLRMRDYGHCFNARRLPAATYVFADLDRLDYWALEQAAHLYRQLAAAGLRLLNDPARSSQRYGLLRRLHEAGINDFDAWSLSEQRLPTRYPVFLRTAAAHRGILSGLLHTPADLEACVEQALAAGLPERELLVVEYCAEPVRPGLFRKLATFRVGDALVPAPSVHDDQWVAKNGQRGIAGPELYAEEARLVREQPHDDTLRRTFELARIDYGRADYGLVAGRPQVYEINTNPQIGTARQHPDPARSDTIRYCEQRLHAAFAAIDMVGSAARISVEPHPRHAKRLRKQRWRRRLGRVVDSRP